MKISSNGLAVMKHFEDCELEAYPDPGSELGKACTARKLPMRDYRQVPDWQKLSGSPWTIGWGHTGREVKPGLVWHQAQADRVLLDDLARFETGVDKLVTISLKQGQFDALVSFSYNVGLEALKNSTLLEMVNNKRHDQALAQFARWNKSGGRVLKGLVRRRAAESWLWRDASGAEAIRKGAAAA